MQFFTDELYETGQSHAEYERYWQENSARMPKNLLRINGGMLPSEWFPIPDDAIFLHDARIRYVDSPLPHVTIQLRGDHRGALREISLHYCGVFECTEVPSRLLAETPDADLMCHETTVLGDGRFNHKMLFASSDVLSISFVELKINVTDHPLNTSSVQREGRTKR